MAEVENIMGRTMDTELAKQAKKIAQEKVREAMKSSYSDEEEEDEDSFLEFDGEGDLSDFEDDENEDEEGQPKFSTNATKLKDADMDKMLKEIEIRDSFDIFTDVGEMWAKEGQIVRYAINKNGKRLTSADHPLTWEDIQTKFGGGNYKIEARLPALANRYLKAQSKYLASATGEVGTREYNTPAKIKEETKQPTIEEVMKLMQTQQEAESARRRYDDEKIERVRLEAEHRAKQAREEAKMEAQEKLSSQERMLEKMMEMNRPQTNNNGSLIKELTPIITALAPFLLKKEEPKNDKNEIFDMMMRMQEMNNKMFETMNKNNEKQMSTLQESIKEIAKQSATPKEDKYDAFALLKLAQDSESRAFEKFTLMSELAGEKARELAEAKEEATPAIDRESSTFDKILTTLGPSLVGMLAGGTKAPTPTPVQAPVQRALPTHVQNVQPRSSVSRTSQNPNRGTNHAEGTPRNSVQTTSQNKNEGSHQLRQVGSEHGKRPSNVTTSRSVGPSVMDFMDTTEKVTTQWPEVEDATFEIQPEVTIVPTTVTTTESIKDHANLERINGIIFPLVLESLGNESATIHNVAEKSVNELVANGIDLSTVKRDFDEEALSGIMEIVPNDYHGMIGDLRSEIFRQIAEK